MVGWFVEKEARLIKLSMMVKELNFFLILSDSRNCIFYFCFLIFSIFLLTGDSNDVNFPKVG